MKKGARNGGEQAEGFFGSFAGKRVGIDIWDFSLELAIREVLPTTEFADGYQNVLMRAKEIKTQDEILCLKMANTLTEAGASTVCSRPYAQESRSASCWRSLGRP